ncbi:MAG: MBL fold metallo-hydrolase [Alphaproteobacteria bacterium]|nr:MBL fold metallo-hydrolase [Alphaproteobacteria bacterium]
MIIRQIPVKGIIETYAYFYIDEQSKHGFLIDAGAEAERLLQIIKDNDWIIEKILITHGHFDHIGAVAEVSKELHIPYLAHRNAKDYLTNPTFNLSSFFGGDITLFSAEYFDEDTEIVLSANPNIKLKVFHTPGHTQDGVVYYDAANNSAFVGDTIFKQSVGRTDIPGGNYNQLMQSIKNKIFTLPADTILYSGHTEPTTVRQEMMF